MREEDITFDQPKREASAKWSQPTLNFFLYDVRENAMLRQHHMDRVEPPSGGNGNGMQTSSGAQASTGAQTNVIYQKRPPMRVDCFYMVTAWALHPLDSHRLLSNCLMILYKYSALPDFCLQGRLLKPLFPLRARVANHDVLTNPAEVWSSLDNEMRASFSYVITLALDPWKPEATKQVESFKVNIGPSEADTVPLDPLRPRAVSINQPPASQMQSRRLPRTKAIFEETVQINGQVRNKANKGKAVADMEVVIEGTGLTTRTDAQGHFRFGRILFKEAEITLIVDPSGPQRKEHKTSTVVTRLGQYDVEVEIEE